jgi:hypothetical protein
MKIIIEKAIGKFLPEIKTRVLFQSEFNIKFKFIVKSYLETRKLEFIATTTPLVKFKRSSISEEELISVANKAIEHIQEEYFFIHEYELLEMSLE